MRSISNFSTISNRKHRRRLPQNTQNGNNNVDDSGRNHPAPVWGRSAAGVVSMSSSSPLNKNNNSKSSSGNPRSLSKSPNPPSSIWGRSGRSPTSLSPHQTRRLATKNTHFDQQRGLLRRRSRSLSPKSPVDHRDEITSSNTLLRHQPRQLLAPQTTPMGHDLCTIVENRNMSSNTLSQMAITSTAAEIAKSPVLSKRRPQENQQQGHKTWESSSLIPRFCDPYNDDDDSRNQDCCWALQKSPFQNCWPCWKQSEAAFHNNSQKENIARPNTGRTTGLPNAHRPFLIRRTSF